MLQNLSHRGRLLLTDRDRLALIHRMSTNDLNKLQPGYAMPTVLTSPIGRIIDQITMLHAGDQVFVMTGQGRGEQIRSYVQRNIFFNDKLKVSDVSPSTGLYALYGSDASAVLSRLFPEINDLAEYQFAKASDVFVLKIKPLAGAGYWLFGESAALDNLIEQLKVAGVPDADPAEIERLRIAAGYPEAGHEITEDYIPLETGLWDHVSFSKGCYTGQEIIARMESRGKLAKLLVKLAFDTPLPTGTTLFSDKEKVGTLTSAASQDDQHFIGLGYVKTAVVQDRAMLNTETGIPVQIVDIAGVQPGK